MEILRQNAQCPNTLFFIDPPYTVAGKKAGSRLYTRHELDHEELFRLADQLSGDFLMTYDDTEDVRYLAQQHGFDMRTISMKNTHHAEMTELLIGRNLSWLNEANALNETAPPYRVEKTQTKRRKSPQKRLQDQKTINSRWKRSLPKEEKHVTNKAGNSEHAER